MIGLRRQLALLDRFAGDLASGTAGSVATALARARLYVQHAARQAANAGRRRVAVLRGATRERNVLHARESCAGCLVETARGWVPLGELVPVGQREPCRQFCRCSIVYE